MGCIISLLDCMAGLTVAVVSVGVAGLRPASGHTVKGMSEREPAINTGVIKSKIRRAKESVVISSRQFVIISTVFRWFCLSVA